MQSFTQQTSPVNEGGKFKIKIGNNKRKKENLILEQEEYQLPMASEETTKVEEFQEYSLNHEVKNNIHHDFNMLKQSNTHRNRKTKDSNDESIN